MEDQAKERTTRAQAPVAQATKAEVTEPIKDLYEECTEKIGLRRHSGEFENKEEGRTVSYVSYYLTIGDDVRIKVWRTSKWYYGAQLCIT